MSRRIATAAKRPKTSKDQLLALARQAGVLRPRALDAEDIPREYLRRRLAKGLLERPGRGIYVAAGLKPTPHHTLAEASKRVPHGVVCLLSALQFYELTLTGQDLDLNRSQGDIGLFVPDAGYPFGEIPDWLIRQRAKRVPRNGTQP